MRVTVRGSFHVRQMDFLSRVSTLTRDSDIAILSVRPSVRPSVCLSERPGIR